MNECIIEDMLRIFITDTDGDKMVFSKFMERDELPISLNDIASVCMKYPNVREITVLAENPLDGRVLRFNALTGRWKLIGMLIGYA